MSDLKAHGQSRLDDDEYVDKLGPYDEPFRPYDLSTPRPPNYPAFLQSGHESRQEQREQGAVVSDEMATGFYLDAYHKWNAIPAAQRPMPTRAVLSGHARKQPKKLNSTDVVVFEAAHGIPAGTLKLDRGDHGYVAGVGVRASWAPETFSAIPLDAEQLEVLARVDARRASSAEAYRAWASLPPERRIPPSGKVVAGHANKQAVRNLNRSHLVVFEAAHGIPAGTLEIDRDEDTHVVGVSLRKKWTPEKYVVQGPTRHDLEPAAVPG